MIEENVLDERKDNAPPAQTLSGNAPIASAERVLQHGPDNHGLNADCER
ncbi:MAG: hypothetical protein IPK75_18290 [Acidobacteria bacterium]|nr:hypothetical protein [Acidobacteriota bacterium]